MNTVNTVVDNLIEMSGELKTGIENLLLNYTTIYSDGVFSSSGDHYWGSLSKEGLGVQSGIFERQKGKNKNFQYRIFNNQFSMKEGKVN